jgi:pilus assembly protein CpaE
LFPAKGGVGATALATNLGGALVAEGKRAILVDLDLQLGDVLTFLDLASRYTIADVLANQARLDRDLLTSSVARHRSGVFVAAQSDHLEDSEKVKAAQVGPLLQFLSGHFDFVLCDGLRGFDEMALAALDASQQVLFVLTQDVPAIKNAQRCLDVFRRLGYDDGKVGLVVNRHSKNEKIDLQAIADNLGLPIGAAVTNDYPTMSRAINRGLLLSEAAPNARVTEDISNLGRMLIGMKPKRARGGFFRSLFGRDEADTRSAESTSATTTPGGAAHGTKRAPEPV